MNVYATPSATPFGSSASLPARAAMSGTSAGPIHAIGHDAQDVRPPAWPTSEVGDADDFELEPLGAVDRHQPHGVQRLALHGGFAFARLDRTSARDEIHERSEVSALRRLALAGESHQL